MTFLFLLSKEHPDLPRAEVESVLSSEGIEFEVEGERENLLFVEADEISGVGRLAMCFEVSELLHEFEPSSYQKLATKDLSTEGTFAVRKVEIDDTEYPGELESNVGRIINNQSPGNVNLEDPDVLFRIYLLEGSAYLCRLVETVDRSQYEERQNQYRPFSSPVSLHPRLARALVNLSGVKEGDSVLDPFCGTGGILIEAGLMGCEIFGADVQEEMVEGALENLRAFDLEGEVKTGNFSKIQDLFDRTFDAVVTDLPYGRASREEGEVTEEFVELAPELSDKVIFMSNEEEIGDMEPSHEIFVHRSLTRYVYVLG